MRVAGFLIVLYGMWEIWGGLDNFAENLLAAGDDNSDQPSSVSYFVFGIPAIITGTICFFLADWIVRAAYRHPNA